MEAKQKTQQVTDDEIRMRFFKDLSAEQRLAVFKAFDVYPANCTEKLNHGIERRLLNAILKRRTDATVLAAQMKFSAAQPAQELPPLPVTYYNGYSDGSEPLYTAEQMHDYAQAARGVLGMRLEGARQMTEILNCPFCGSAAFKNGEEAECGSCGAAHYLTEWNRRAAAVASEQALPQGWKLAMRVIQSDLYHELEDDEQAVCNALIMQNPHIAVAETLAAASAEQKAERFCDGHCTWLDHDLKCTIAKG